MRRIYHCFLIWRHDQLIGYVNMTLVTWILKSCWAALQLMWLTAPSHTKATYANEVTLIDTIPLFRAINVSLLWPHHEGLMIIFNTGLWDKLLSLSCCLKQRSCSLICVRFTLYFRLSVEKSHGRRGLEGSLVLSLSAVLFAKGPLTEHSCQFSTEHCYSEICVWK